MSEYVDIYNRFTNEVQFSAPIETIEGDSPDKKRGRAVRWALENAVNTEGADFSGADLRGIDFSGVALRYCDMSHVHLSAANLSGARLDHVTLSGANLTLANLTGARLINVSLSGAYLDGAQLVNTDLTGSFIFGANFGTASISNVVVADGVAINRTPVQVSGIGTRQLLIFDAHMRLDSWTLSLTEWATLSARNEKEIDSKHGTGFWASNRQWLLLLARSQGRRIHNG